MAKHEVYSNLAERNKEEQHEIDIPHHDFKSPSPSDDKSLIVARTRKASMQSEKGKGKESAKAKSQNSSKRKSWKERETERKEAKPTKERSK